jgi:hypothetical protein
MTDRHRNRPITPRLDDNLRERFQAEVSEQQTNMNAVIVALLRWWLRMPGAKLPPRAPLPSRRD